jgi:bacterioferritin
MPICRFTDPRDRRPSTRVMLMGILSVEEEHATDMRDLLVAHEGKPSLQD